jgi:hypothetical protein
MYENNKSFERAMTLAALSGLKIALGPAFLAASQRRPEARSWALAALGEMFLDKIGVFPARYRPMLLIPHTLAGAWVAHESMKADGVNDPYAAAMGAVVAAGVAAVAPMVRITGSKVLGIPDPILGLAEDYFALRMGTEATGLTLGEVTDTARDSLEDVRDRVVMPALHSAGIVA